MTACCCDPPNPALQFRRQACDLGDGCNDQFSIEISGLRDSNVDCPDDANGTFLLTRISCGEWRLALGGTAVYRLQRVPIDASFAQWVLALRVGSATYAEWSVSFGPIACPIVGSFTLTRVGVASPEFGGCRGRQMFVTVTGVP